MKYSLNFKLIRPDKDSRSSAIKSIGYDLTWLGNRLRKSTGKQCRQRDWIEADSKGLVQRVNSKFEYSIEINTFLSDLENRVENFFTPLNRVPGPDEVLAVINNETYVRNEFKDLFIKFIEDTQTGERKAKKGKKIKASTIKKYRHTLNILEQFERDKGIKLKWSNINDSFYVKLTNYMWNELDYYDNACGSIIKVLRVFLNWCYDEGYITKKPHNSTWVIWKEDIDIVVLYPDELNLLFNLEPPTERLQRTRDIFLAGCMTCLRVSNLLKLSKENLTGNTLKVISVKVDKPVIIECPPLLMQIFNKYDNLLPKISDQQFNKALKDLSMWLGNYINENKGSLKEDFIGNDWSKKFLKTRYKRGEPVQVSIDMKDMITSHTMRRTGITNLLMMGLSEIEVKNISGHSLSSDDFAKYVKIAERFISKKSTKAWSIIAGQ